MKLYLTDSWDHRFLPEGIRHIRYVENNFYIKGQLMRNFNYSDELCSKVFIVKPSYTNTLKYLDTLGIKHKAFKSIAYCGLIEFKKGNRIISLEPDFNVEIRLY